MNNLALIPARGGSKRIPRKNIRDFCGKPIVAWPIQATIDSGCFSEIMVSTDDPEIAEIAERWGAKVPFFRSAETSTDQASVSDVVWEVLTQYKQQGRCFDLACCIYPTAALLSAERLRQAYDLLMAEPRAEGLITIFGNPENALRALVIQDGWIRMMMAEYWDDRFQNLPETYFDAGQMYWVRPAAYLELGTKAMMPLKRLPIVMSEFEAQDINTLDDWELAELKHAFLEQHKLLRAKATRKIHPQ